jgi:hypothetical protein
VYDAVSGAPGVRVPNAGGWTSWAPDGHRLALASGEGLFVIAAPGDARAAPERLSDEACYRALWAAPAGAIN